MDTVTAAAPTLSIGGVALVVRDLEHMAGFYQRVVGLEVIDWSDGLARLGAGGSAFLELRHHAGARPRDPAAAGLYHTAFLLPQRADLGRWLAHAGSLGQVLDGAADHLVSEAVYLHDPEGNGVEIYVDRDPAAWVWTAEADGKRVRMANDRLDMIGLRALATRPWASVPVGSRIGHVHLQVGDVAEAERFYAGVIGMAVTRRWPQAVFLSTGGYHHHLAANTWHSAGAGRRDKDEAGLGSVTLLAQPGAMRTSGTLTDPWGTEIRFSAA